MSMNDCEKELARLIHVIVEYGNYVEEARIELAKNIHFSPFASFRRINASSTGFLTDDDLDSFLRQNGLALNDGALAQFFTIEKDKSYKITYNNFLNQVLPTTDINLRNSCLERPHNYSDNEVNYGDVDQLITAVYQKENEYTRVVEGVKTKLLSFSNPLLERIFQSLADDVTGYLSFKSISTYMKQANYSFGKRDYESLMSRIDKNLTGKISPTDFKYQMFPHGTITTTHRTHDQTHHKAGSIFSGISPIKNWNSSPNKGTGRKPFEVSIVENDRSLSTLKAKSNVHSPDNKFPHNKSMGAKVGPSGLKSEQKFRSTQKPFEGAPGSRAVLYNQEIAAINDQIILQNAPEATYNDKNSKNPLEWRFLDPVYHNYWSYHRDHNRTLSPDYFNRAESRTLMQQRSHNPSRPGTNFVPFYNPTFVDPGTYENLERYPENPFRYTDHGHFFKNYYASLRHNYYDQYYNHIPYKAKISSERNSPNKSGRLSRSGSPQRNLDQVDYNYLEQQQQQQQPMNFARRNDNFGPDSMVPPQYPIRQNVPYQTQPEKPPRRTTDLLAEHEVHRQPQPQQQKQADFVPYQYVFVNDGNTQGRPQEEKEVRSAIRIEKQPFLVSPKVKEDPLKDFSRDRREPQINQDLNSNKPYTFVVVNNK